MTNWAQILQDSISQKPEPVPAGWYTAQQLREAYNLAETTMQRRLKLLTADGTVEMKTFRIQSGSRVVPVPHYRLLTESLPAAA